MFFPTFALEVLLELRKAPHVPWNFIEHLKVIRSFNALLDYRVVCKMRKEVFRAARVVIIAAEAQVALLVNIDSQRVPAWDDDPHADIKFSIHDQHWVLNVLLDDPCLLGVALGVIERHLSLNLIHVVLRIDHVLVGARSCSLCVCSLYLLGWVHFCIL